MWIDCHAHLFDYNHEQLKDIINEATAAAVDLIISTSTDIATARIVADQCSNFPQIFGAIGISPFDVEVCLQDDFSSLRQLLKDQKKIVAIGEIGLDNSNPRYPSLEKQFPVFEKQILLARECHLPAVIHSRGFESQTADFCFEKQLENAVFHCFTGDYYSAKKILDHGYFISFSGIVTFKNAAIRELLPRVPLDRILIETDAPYLAPVPYRGQTNKPAFVHFTGKAIAELLRIDPDEFQVILQHNVHTCFNISKNSFH